MSALASVAATATRALAPARARAATKVPLLITPTELVALPQATTKLLDVSWHMPTSPRNPSAEYLAGPRIPGALRWDLDAVANPKTPAGGDAAEPESWRTSGLARNELALGHMLPGPRRFAEACSKLGIKPTDHVVVYDSLGIFSAPRGAFTFTAMNHGKVSVLDGGLPRYRVEGHVLDEQSLTSEAEALERAGVNGQSEYPVPTFKRSHVKTYDQVVENTKQDIEASTADLILDARSRERQVPSSLGWSGAAPEPRAGLSSGHMPHALSLPFTALLSPASASDPAAGRPYTAFLPVEQLRTVLIRALASPRAVLDLSVPRGGLTAEELALGERRWEEVVTGARGVTWSCGSGMTAAVGIWAMRLVAAAEGREALENVALYDESWTGYAMRESSEIVKE